MTTPPRSWRPAAALSTLVLLSAASVQAAEKPTVQQQIDELQKAVAAQKAQLEAQQRLLDQQAALIEQLRQQQQQPGAAAETEAKVAALEQTVTEQKLKD